jgi:hypothetical protein
MISVVSSPRLVSWIGISGLSILLAACQIVRPDSAVSSASAQTQIVERLYFGRSIPGGGTVSDEEWAAFLAEVVTPRFPSGLTVWHAEGQWREQSGHIAKEPTVVVELIHPPGPEMEKAIQDIVREYRRRFRQEAVMRTRDRLDVSF